MRNPSNCIPEPREKETGCVLCLRDTKTTRHHLIPASRKRHEGDSPKIPLCPTCHRKIHATFDNKQLAREYSTIEKIREAPEIQKYLKWIQKQPVTTYFGSADVQK
jgi:hypothetical protein